MAAKNRLFSSCGATETLDVNEIRARFAPLVERIRPYVKDTSVYLNQAIGDAVKEMRLKI